MTAEGPGKWRHLHSTPTHFSQEQDTSSNEIVDLTNADPCDYPQAEPRQIYHEDVSESDEADTIEWNPEDDLGGADVDDTVILTLKYVNNEGATQSIELHEEPVQDLHLPSSSADGLPSLHVPSILEAQVQTAVQPQDLPSSSTRQLFVSASAASSADLEDIRHASIHRIKVVKDLLAVFMDSSIVHSTLKMDFVNEKAIDDAGVSREVYTAFWEQFLEQCEGETERVPRLRPDFGEAEWQAVGRIWVKGLLDHGVIPVRLSKAFIVACIYGTDSIDGDILLTSFLNFLAPVERSVVERALQGTMEEGDEEDLLDLFTSMGSHFLPTKENMETAIETMAHKAIIQEPKYIIDCFSTPMALVQPNLPDKERVLSLYETKKATGKRVCQLLETTKLVLSQREQTTFNHLQRYVKNADQTKAEKILRFCTGSSVICVEKILVTFNAEIGLNRRPVAHTCGATLEVPCTYSSYPEFRTEFDNILSSSYFEMDIL
ncbi:uncharacterized protein LOC127351975 [Dicentrarchus labrax]|uniref:uncharacterized protein LOC127351975 n=1 Tax=Dicentrarchus labrax TaxID=13489 RepID=UPI0021F605C4|nr:uncharacterized protein LOC127351975 [Dicentrarchus labrax]XP_051235988.1 uncharacterized protein LOC127351975 [Dicentrarchus labrax]XP_051235989.1 uncharacterized protein LOC127351975 [Dicentrarchus labrax]